ncbi:MAG: hypothetical protein FJ291_03300, partial [Planctomycetes bacterium]|nr:hypothetical protein [Planctomycetota bacterium]
MRLWIAAVGVGLWLLSTAPFAGAVTPVEAWGQLRVEGKNIVSTKTGQPVQLAGMDLFWSQWSGELWNADVVNWLVDDWKCSVLRISMGVEAGGYLENPAREKAKVITVVDACIKRGIYVIIDWHDHHAENHLAQSKAFFAEMAKRYAGKPNVMYELYNEPEWTSWDAIKNYANQVTAEIRKFDPDNIVCVATPNWDRTIEVVQNSGRVNDKNSVYVCHFYAATDNQTLRNKVERAAKAGVPIFVTEWGTSEGTGDGRIDLASTKAFWDILDRHKIGHANWSIVHKKESSAAITTKAPSNPTAANPWTDAHLTPSGKVVREKLRSYPPPGNAASRDPEAKSETPKPPRKLVIVRAVYGDLAGDRVADVTAKVKDLATTAGLTVVANNANFGDPAFGAVKKLKVEYTLDGKRLEKTVEENETLTIELAGAPESAPAKPEAAPGSPAKPEAGRPAAKAPRVFHIGNSLTDHAYAMHDIVKGKGHTDVVWGRFMIPGAPIRHLWSNPGGGWTDV